MQIKGLQRSTLCCKESPQPKLTLHGGILGRRARGTKDGEEGCLAHQIFTNSKLLLVVRRRSPSILTLASRVEIRSSEISKRRAH